MLVVGAHLLQHLRLHPRVHELGVAHLEDARQPQAHLVDELGAFRRTRLGHDHLHSVGSLHRLVVRRALGAEELAAPGLLAVGAAAVEDPHVAGVGAVLVEVEPVVFEMTRALHQPLPAVVHQRRVVGQRRRIVGGRSHVGEDQAPQAPHRVGRVLHLGAKAGLGRLGRLLQAVARDVVEPAVVRAADAALLDVAVLQRRAAVGAVPADEAQLPREVPEQHQVLPQHPHRPGDVVQLLLRANREPVAPQPLAARRAASHPRYVLVCASEGVHAETLMAHPRYSVSPGSRRGSVHGGPSPAPPAAAASSPTWGTA